MKAKNIEFWEQVVNKPPESYRSWFKDERELLQKIISKNSKVLEIGCGDGRSFHDIINIVEIINPSLAALR